MQRQFILSFIVVSAFILISAPAFADSSGSFSFSWGSDRHDEEPPAPARESRNGPPEHAPAHGYRSHHRYQYYPSASVYHDVDRGVYFYLSGSNWQVAASLPQALRVRLGGPVSLEMDTAKPYIYYDQHRRKYPPGQMKKAQGHKGHKGHKGRKK